MAKLVHSPSGRISVLEQCHSIGRASGCALRIEDRYVSSQHALLRYTGERWELKDLGSRNGTYLNKERIPPTEFQALKGGSRVAFGKVEQEWELIDPSAPTTMVVPADDSEPVLVDVDVVAIPSPDEPCATIYRTGDGTWLLEQATSVTPIGDHQTFHASGKTWKFCCIDDFGQTSLATLGNPEVRHLQLTFSVSRDEEHVHLQASCGSRRFDLGDRGHNYLLLTLARRRLNDMREGLPEGSCGWVCQDDIGHDPSMAPPQLNIDVFRIRRQFAAVGIVDAASIIERRPRTRQLRIGISSLSIVVI